MALRPVNPVGHSLYVNLHDPLRIRANDVFPQQSLAFRAPQLADIRPSLVFGQGPEHQKFGF
jgi:hypothetical protein